MSAYYIGDKILVDGEHFYVAQSVTLYDHEENNRFSTAAWMRKMGYVAELYVRLTLTGHEKCKRVYVTEQGTFVSEN
jgi:hypothetical protein